MKILPAECVPLQVRLALTDHEVTTAQRMGWSGISNGDLLDKAEREGFQVFIVADKISAISKIFLPGGLQFSNSGQTTARRWKNISRKSAPLSGSSRQTGISIWKLLETSW